MATKETSRNIYIKKSRKALGRLLKECTEDHIPTIRDKRCCVFKLGCSVDDINRGAGLRSSAYGGVDDWEFFIYDGEICSFPFPAGLEREGRFHRWLKNANGIHHLTAKSFPWLYDKDNHASIEVYFGNPISVAKYIRSTLLADPVELAALRSCRDQVAIITKKHDDLAIEHKIVVDQLQMAKSAANANRYALSKQVAARELAEAGLLSAQGALHKAISRAKFWRSCSFVLAGAAIAGMFVATKNIF